MIVLFWLSFALSNSSSLLGSYDRLEKFRFGRSRSLPTPARLGAFDWAFALELKKG